MTYHLFFCPGNNKDVLQLQLLCIYNDKRSAKLDICNKFGINRVRFEKSRYIGKELYLPNFNFGRMFPCMISPINSNNRLYLVKIENPTIGSVMETLNEIRPSIV